MKRVALLTRRPRPSQNFSIETIVAGLKRELGREFHAEVLVSRFESKGVLPRVYNVIEAALRQRDINHVTGDVHFLTYLLRRGSIVLTVHDCGRIAGRKDLRSRLVKLLWFSIPVRRSSVVTVVSETVKRDLLHHVNVPADKVVVVPNAVPAHFVPSPKDFDADKPVILQVGTKPNKNLERLVKALAGISCRLHVIGQLSESQRVLLRESRVEFENFVGLSELQMQECYAAADILAFVSTFEGFGMPVIEANRVGRPVLASNVASLPEIAGEAACLVDPYDVDAIRTGVLRLVQDADYRQELITRGFVNAQRFHPQNVAQMYESVYRSLAAGGRQDRGIDVVI